jgi:DNA-binding NtrC family response regulator
MSEVHDGDITKRTLEALQAYDWPGNVRELQNVDSEKLAQKHFQLSSRTMSRRSFGRDQNHCQYSSKVTALVLAGVDKTFTTSPVTVTAVSTSNALYSFYG